MRSTLLHDRAIMLSKAKVHVYSDSVLPDFDKEMERPNWMVHGYESTESRSRSSGTFSQDLLHEIQRRTAEEIEDRIIFMPMYNDIDWTEEENFKIVFRTLRRLRLTHTDFTKKRPSLPPQYTKSSSTASGQAATSSNWPGHVHVSRNGCTALAGPDPCHHP